MDIHDKITNELFERKSIAAFIWLINQGRELEFSYHHINCFVSRDHSKSFVSLWLMDEEQAFESVEDLFKKAIIDKQRLCDVWEHVTLGCLF